MKFSTILVLSLGFQISACSLIKSADQPRIPDASMAEPQATSQATPQTLIAQDFVNALSQLDSMQAGSTTVAMLASDRQDDFTLAMLDALAQAGYGIRWVEQADAASLFQYRRDQERAAGGIDRDIYELAVGSVEMRRGYASDAQRRVRPVTPLYVRGADASNITVNENLFNSGNSDLTTAAGRMIDNSGATEDEEVLTQANGVDAVGVAPAAPVHRATAPTLALQNSSRLRVPADANPLDPLVGRAATAPAVSLPVIAAPLEHNVFDLGGSNFQNLLADYTVVKEQVLTFANDSMRLGQSNKQLVNQLVASFNPQTDVFSLIGCSMGATQVKGGNAALALGRADRVAEALRFAGVDDSQILDEGCWAGDGSLESLPRRGVVLTLNRRS